MLNIIYILYMVNIQIWKIAKPTLRKKYIHLLKIAAINNQRIAIRKRMLQDRRKRMLIEANNRVLIEDNENKISVELKAKHNTDLKENDIDGINNTTDLIENTNELDSVYSEQDETLLIFHAGFAKWLDICLPPPATSVSFEMPL